MTGSAIPDPLPSPLVSVLLPVRDAGAYLGECIASLRAQSLREVEYIAVDDGSRDESRHLLEGWAGTDPRVRVVRQGRLGLVSALERARAEARAPILARMDADDIALRDRLRLQLDLMRARSDVVLCGTGVEYFPSEIVREGARRYQRWINAATEPSEIHREIFIECPVAHPTFMMRADAVQRVGGYREMGWPEDYDLILRLWRAGGRFAKVPKTLVRWRERPDRYSRTHPDYAPKAFRRLKVEVLRTTLWAQRDGLVVWGAGPTGKAFARTVREQGVELRAFVDLNPRKLGQEIHGAPVISPHDVGRYAGAFSVAAVAQPGAREDIRSALERSGQREMEDFCAVA